MPTPSYNNVLQNQGKYKTSDSDFVLDEVDMTTLKLEPLSDRDSNDVLLSFEQRDVKLDFG